MPESLVSPICAEEIPSAASVMARAFAESPRSGFSSPVRHSGRKSCAGTLARLSAPVCSQGASSTWSAMRSAVLYEALLSGDHPEQGRHTALTLVRSGLWAAPVRLGISAYRRKRSLGRLLSSLDAPQPCWYLNTIGVEPSEQGTGLGTALLDFMLRRVDEDALPSFLDTSLPDNLGYYERFGFRVTAESALPKGIPLWGMTRQPRTV